MRGFAPLVLLVLALPLLAVNSAQQPTLKETAGLTAISMSGKETTFKKWKVVHGTRRIVGELEPIKPAEKDAKPAPAKQTVGQEYFEFREDNSTTFKDGILTLVPLSSLRKLDYDAPKKTVAVTVAGADGKDIELAGSTEYVGINQLTIDVTVEAFDLGASNLRLQGGLIKPLVLGFRFPTGPPAPKVTGPGVVLVGVDKKKTEYKVRDLRALYRVGGADQISPYLLFKKDAKIEVANIVKLRKAPAANKKTVSLEWEVTQADGKQTNLLLVKDVFPDNGQTGQLLGLIGKVSAGYKLFPMHCLTEMHKEEAASK